MKKQHIEFRVEHQRISRIDDFYVVGGSQRYLHARFQFCEDWEGEEAYAVFSGGGKSYRQKIVDGECVVPWEVLLTKQFFVGCEAGDRITSDAARVDVRPSGAPDADPGREPSPTLQRQIDNLATKVENLGQAGGAQPQPDLAQNDETAPDYVKGRTHWVEEKGIAGMEIVPEHSFTPHKGPGVGIIDIATSSPMVVGETYIVTLNGATYECVSRIEENSVSIGNAAVCPFATGEEGNGEPFYIKYYAARNEITAYLDNTGTNTMSIAVMEYTLVYHPLDEKFIPDTIARVSDIPEPTPGVTSWNDLTDKPFGEEGTGAVIEWDGDTEGREMLSCPSENETFYKISDLTPSYEDLLGGNIDDINEWVDKTISSDNITLYDDVAVVGSSFAVFYKADVTVNHYGYEYTAPSTGIYGLWNEYYQLMKLSYGSVFVEQLDDKFIPDTIQRVGDKQLVLASSTPGSTKKFAITVTDDGTLTATEIKA